MFLVWYWFCADSNKFLYSLNLIYIIENYFWEVKKSKLLLFAGCARAEIWIKLLFGNFGGRRKIGTIKQKIYWNININTSIYTKPINKWNFKKCVVSVLETKNKIDFDFWLKWWSLNWRKWIVNFWTQITIDKHTKTTILSIASNNKIDQFLIFFKFPRSFHTVNAIIYRELRNEF